MVGKPGLDVVGHNNPHQTLVGNVDVFGQHRLQCHEIRIAVSAQDQLEIRAMPLVMSSALFCNERRPAA